MYQPTDNRNCAILDYYIEKQPYSKVRDKRVCVYLCSAPEIRNYSFLDLLSVSKMSLRHNFITKVGASSSRALFYIDDIEGAERI